MKEIKAYSKLELVALYGITLKTFHSWIEPYQKELGLYKGKRFTVKQIEFLFSKLGNPQ
jgi:hypothetical protein